MPGARALQGAGAGAVRARRIRQRPRSWRRHGPARPRRQGLACQIQLSGNRNRRDRGVARPASARVPSVTTSPEGLRDVRHQPAPAHPPVTDWVHDFDHTDPQWTEDPFPIWDELRAASPVVHTERFLGCYMPTTYEAVREIANDSEHFSSRRIIVRDVRPEITSRNSAP